MFTTKTPEQYTVFFVQVMVGGSPPEESQAFGVSEYGSAREAYAAAEEAAEFYAARGEEVHLLAV